MRTTLTLDDDVAARLHQLQQVTGEGFKSIVNQALRVGIQQLQSPPQGARQAYRTRPVSLGKCRLGDVVSVTQALAAAESDDFK